MHFGKGTNINKRALCALCFIAALSAAAFTGCSAQDKEPELPEVLPAVAAYADEVSSLKTETDTEASECEETTGSSAVKKPDIDSETVIGADAASSETETVPTEDNASETSSAETVISEEETVISEESETSAATETSAEIVTTAETTSVQTTAATTAEQTAAETTAAAETTVTQAPAAAAAREAAPTDYDTEFFESDLFVGDSISTGYSLYGFLDDKNVYAKVGLNPSTVLTKNVSTVYGEIGISDMLAYTAPKRVYVMLGSNGIQWLSVGNMLQSTHKLVSLIKESNPDTEVVIVSVPPVTLDYDNTIEDIDVMAKIDEYNTSLSSYCSANHMLYVDAASILKDDTGYFDSRFSESDGMHFKSSAYKTLLSKIQSDVTDFFGEETETVTQTETEMTVTEEAAAEETLPETFLTLPESETDEDKNAEQ